MVLSCLSGTSLSKGFQSVLGSRPWRPPQDLPRTGPFAIEIVLKVKQNPAPFQNRDSIGNFVLQGFFGASLVPPRLSKWLFPASLVPRRLSNGSFPASLKTSNPKWKQEDHPMQPWRQQPKTLTLNT